MKKARRRQNEIRCKLEAQQQTVISGASSYVARFPEACLPTTHTDKIAELLRKARNIAVVGLSSSPMRASHGVAAYLQSQGYRIIPVNPEIREALGEQAYPSLLDVPEKIDIVDVFRRSEAVPEIVRQAIQLKIPAVWMQETVIHEAAAEEARLAGIFVVMDRCILKEHRVRFG